MQHLLGFIKLLCFFVLCGARLTSRQTGGRLVLDGERRDPGEEQAAVSSPRTSILESPSVHCFPKQMIATRHAQAAHNAAIDDQRAEKEDVLKDPFFYDASLTTEGLDKSASIGAETLAEIIKKKEPAHPSVVLVSPMQRTRDTARLVWQSVRPVPPLVGFDIITEKRTGDRPCDERKSLETIQTQEAEERQGERASVLLNNDVSPDLGLTPPLGWTAFVQDDKVDALKEDDNAVRARAAEFLQWASEYQSEMFAIVSHNGFLREMETAMGLYGIPPGGDPIDESKRKEAKKYGYKNLESRVYIQTCTPEGVGFWKREAAE